MEKPQDILSAQELMDRIVETLHEPVVVLHANLTVRFCNPAFYQRFHVQPAETEGRMIYELGNGQWDIPALRQLLEDVLPSHNVFSDFEVHHDFENIGPCTMLVNARRLDHVQMILLGIRDITLRKRDEEVLRDANRRKDEFLATLGHELRNPLTPISTAWEILRMAENKEAAFEEVYETFQRQMQQLTRLIDDLLDMSRIARGKLEMRKSLIALRDVVKAAVEVSQPLINEAGHELTVSIPEGPIYLEADPHRLAQVFSNLLNNAARYTPHGGRIELTAWWETEEVVVSVKDNGIGIPADMQGRVFEIFSQVHTGVEAIRHGLGIGLSLVKSLVEAQGGTIQLQSDGIGEGSEFRIRLPILANPPETFNVPAPPEEETTRDAKRRVLVVDDIKSIRDLSRRMIEILGHTVKTANDGAEAVAVAKEFRPDIVLMDLGMPKMDGYEAARQIRQTDWGKSMTLVSLSGWGQEKDKEKSKAVGFDFHLVKPAAPHDIKRLLAFGNVAQ